MGCDGVGKTARKRKNDDLLPMRYFDEDSFAGGIGDWNSQKALDRTRVYVDAQFAEAIEQRLDFGKGRTYSGTPGPAIVERVMEAGYRVEGVYFGTNDPQIKVNRIEERVFAGTGHRVDPQRVPVRWKDSLSNLRRTAERFDLLRLLDNTEHDDFCLPRPVEQCRMERGEVCWQIPRPAPWCASWLQGLAHRMDELHRQGTKPVSKPTPLRFAWSSLRNPEQGEPPRQSQETQQHRPERDRDESGLSQ